MHIYLKNNCAKFHPIWQLNPFWKKEQQQAVIWNQFPDPKVTYPQGQTYKAHLLFWQQNHPTQLFSAKLNMSQTSFGTARFGSTSLPSRIWGRLFKASSTLSIVLYMTKPNPRDLKKKCIHCYIPSTNTTILTSNFIDSRSIKIGRPTSMFEITPCTLKLGCGK